MNSSAKIVFRKKLIYAINSYLDYLLLIITFVH